MSAEELNHSTSAPEPKFDAPIMSNPETMQPRFNVIIASIGVIITLLLILFIIALYTAPADWVVAILAGLIMGYTLGAVFGIWIGRWIGNAPNLQKFSFATGIVVLNACVGFFGYAYLTSPHASPSIWPDRDNLFFSIGTASTLVSATILCLVNFFWHSHDQKRIQTLRAVVKKNRNTIAETEEKVADAERRVEEANAEAMQQRRRAEEAERQADEERKKAEKAQQEADQARTTAAGAQRTAQQAQHIAEKEKRWRSTRALLLGRWQCAEYAAQPKNTKAAREIVKEVERDRDILIFGADETFSLTHPGKQIGLMEKIKLSLSGDEQHERDVPVHKVGRWTLNEAADVIAITYNDGNRETLKIQSLNKTNLTIDKSSENWELLSFLVKAG